MAQARPKGSDDAFVDLASSMVIDCGVPADEVCEMPYLRAEALIRFLEKRYKDVPKLGKNEFNKNNITFK